MNNTLQTFLNTQYDYKSHTFDKGIILAYNNAVKNPITITDNYISVKQTKKTAVFLLKNIDESFDKNAKIYSEVQVPYTKKKINEVCYNLDEIFINSTKEIRRGMNLLERKEIKFTSDYKSSSIDYLRILNDIFNDWKRYKESDPKVYRITFNPNRYLRSLNIKSYLPSIFQGLYSVNEKPYGVIIFSKHPTESIAYELAFVSRFFDKELKIINDLNFCVLVNAFYQLYQQGIKVINVGTDAGIKGLKLFKKKLPYFHKVIYSN